MPADPTSKENLIDLKIKKIQQLRKNPILTLRLDDLDDSRAWELHEKTKTFHQNKLKNVDVILHTYGGEAGAAYKMVKLIRAAAERVNFIVPAYAKSAGTLLCLGADEILMTDLSELGPLDTQIRDHQDGTAPQYISALNGFKALEQVQKHTFGTLDIAIKLLTQDHLLKLGDAVHLANEFCGETCGKLYSKLDPNTMGRYQRSLDVAQRYGVLILNKFRKWPYKKAKDVVDILVRNFPSHSFILDVEQLVPLGFNATKLVSEESNLVVQLGEMLYDEQKVNQIKFLPYADEAKESKKEINEQAAKATNS
jgi:hypothetical protein